jgi:Transmembrane secretion effector
VRRIVSAYTVNRLGTWFGFIALSIAVYDHTASAAAVAALLLASQVIPAFLVPALVARVETSEHRGALSRLYLFEAAATATLAAVVMWHFTLTAVLVLVALDGTAALAASALLRAAAARAAREWSYDRHAQTMPAAADLPAQTYAGQAGIAVASGESGLTASSVGAEGGGIDARETGALEAERRANAAINIGFALTFTLGPAIAGPTVSTFGVPVALLIDAASFLVCGAMLIDLTPQVQDAETSSVRARLRAAWDHITRETTLRRLLLVQAIALVFFEFSPPIEVAYAKTTLHAGDGGYGLLLGAWGLGAAIGSVVFARSIKRSLGVLLSASTLAVGVAYLGWAIAPSLALACAVGVIGGVGNGVQWAALISTVQRLTPERLHAQLMGAVESIGAISPGIGFALGGVIASAGSPRTALLIAGVGATACTFAFVRLPLGGLTSVVAGPAATDLEAEWAPPDSPHSRDSHPSSVQTSP